MSETQNQLTRHDLKNLRITLQGVYRNLSGTDPDPKNALEIFELAIQKLDKIILSLSEDSPPG